MRFRPNAECPDCNEVYKIDDHPVCPRCPLTEDTKNIITIIEENK
jgi:Zn finger protein HypA/HybF involved in hydrogenase expression